MTTADDLRCAIFSVTLPANAPARLKLPPEDDADNWWPVGGTTWVRALSGRSVQVKKPSDGTIAEVRFRGDGPGLMADQDEDWVWAADATKALAAELLLGILRHLDASVPALPVRAMPNQQNDPHLNWPGGDAGTPEVRQRRRFAGSKALSEYLGLVEAVISNDADPAPDNGLAARLIRHLSAIPRPAEVSLSLDLGKSDIPVLSWVQEGDPDLLWGANKISFGDLSGGVATVKLSDQDVFEQRRLAAWAHLLSMATAIEAATGGLDVPLELRFSTKGDQTVTAVFYAEPQLWGFEIVQFVRKLAESEIPQTFTIHTDR